MKRLVLGGKFGMSAEWTAALPGALIGAASGYFAFWKATGISEARTDEQIRAMRQELTRVEDDNKQLAAIVQEGLQKTFVKVGEMFTELKVQAAEQAAFNKVCTKTLESLVEKQEGHTVLIQKHEIAISVLDNELEKRKA